VRATVHEDRITDDPVRFDDVEGEPAANPSRAGHRIVHADLPIIPSPSGLPSQHIITKQTGATSTFLGQQWLRPGDRVLLHTHPVEEAVMFLTGTGEATLGEETVPIGPGVSLFFPPGLVHGFRNTGTDILHVVIVFPVPEFAETTIVERAADSGRRSTS
jgi:quercetin dioxygenase-like cupin family protein